MIRLYGHSLGEGSFAQVTRGMLRALKAHGSLAGFLPVDDLQEDLEFDGADAPVALNCGAPSMAALPLTVGQHKHRWLLLAPNSNGVPKAIQTLLGPSKLTGFLAPSQWAVEVLQREFPGMPVLLAEHGVSPEIHHPDAREHEQRVLAYRYDEMRVLHVSSTLGQRKGTKNLLRAWSRLRAEKKLPTRATLHVVVHPLASSECRYLARGDDSIFVRPSMSMAPRVYTSVLRAAHLVVQPSRSEGFGLVPLEALCCGTPIVATACTGHSAYLYDAVPGFVRVEHGPDAPIDDFPGATAPTVSEDAIADALVLAIGNWLALASDALACAPALGAAWTWEKRNAAAISEMIAMSK
jgi:glycosyltransferase involved in cell wall biosynthesis